MSSAPAGLWVLGIHRALQKAPTRTLHSRSTVDRQVGEDRVRSALQSTVFYTPSKRARICRLWRLGTHQKMGRHVDLSKLNRSLTRSVRLISLMFEAI